MNTSENKAALRAGIRAARADVPAQERECLARAAALRALELPQVAGARHVLGYAATPEELDSAPLLESLRARGVLLTLPRIAGPGLLTLHAHHGDIPLEEGPFGLCQPTEDHPLTETDDIDLVVVPGIVFDACGSRIGFGGGYYDRLLARLPHAFRLALAYDLQIVEFIATEKHDERVDAVVTPQRTLLAERPR